MDETLDAAAAAATADAAQPAEPAQESLEEMLARHRQEKKELLDKEMNLKKAAAKGSKAEQKAKKKQVEEEISKLAADLEAKQAQERASIGMAPVKSSDKGSIDTIVKEIAGTSLNTQSNEVRLSKGARLRAKRAQEEAERERRIQEEQSNLVSDRMIENEKLERKLEPLGLTINEIKPDGHCLYRAIEDQLLVQSKGVSGYNYKELREMTAKYMKEHASDFLPFFLAEGKAELSSNGSPAESFEKYCDEVRSTASWGGQLELGALAHCLKKHIVIYSGSFPDVEMGKEYKSAAGSSSGNPSITLSYHKHAYGLGEHYNSIVPFVGRT